MLEVYRIVWREKITHYLILDLFFKINKVVVTRCSWRLLKEKVILYWRFDTIVQRTVGFDSNCLLFINYSPGFILVPISEERSRTMGLVYHGDLGKTSRVYRISLWSYWTRVLTSWTPSRTFMNLFRFSFFFFFYWNMVGDWGSDIPASFILRSLKLDRGEKKEELGSL